MNLSPRVCLSIAGLDPSGGAGVIADIKTFTAFRCYGAAAVTSITFQNTLGVYGAVHQSADSVRNQVEPIINDFHIAAVKTGMLPTGEIIDVAAQLIAENGLPNVVVDPVVRSTSGFDLINDKALRRLRDKMFPISDVVTPNIAEAERITGLKIDSYSGVERAATMMRSMGAKNILIKGGHPFEKVEPKNALLAIDFLFTPDGVQSFESEFISTNSTHGTGCSLASAIASNLALGKDLVQAVQSAKQFITEAIRTAPGLGNGHSPINLLVNSR